MLTDSEWPTKTGTRTQVVAMTADRGSAQELERELGLAAVLTKPVRRAQLFTSLAELLSRRTGSAPSMHPGPLHSQPPRPVHRRARGRVLVAEDNVVNQRVCARLLHNLGYRCDVVSNGLEALEALHRAPYDLVLMDCNMPNMDGVEATVRWRESEPEGQHLPILAVTASAMGDDETRYIEAGMDSLLPKPIDPQRLATALTRHIDQDAHDPEQLTHQAASLPAVDVDTLRGLTRAVPESSEMSFLLQMIELFLQYGPRHAKALRSAIQAADLPRAKAASEALRREATAIGAYPLSELAARSIEAAEALEWGDARTLAGAVRDELERAKTGLTSAQDQLLRRSGITTIASSLPPPKDKPERGA